MRSLRPVRRAIVLLAFLIPMMSSPAHAASEPPSAVDGTDASIPQRALLQAGELVHALRQPDLKPLVLQVGSHVLFAEAHIAGSEYAGPAGTPDGLKALQARVASLPKSTPIVLYCGCCPWGRCPNIRPAYQALADMGFTDVKALYLPQNFGTDWVSKGYPVEKGR